MDLTMDFTTIAVFIGGAILSLSGQAIARLTKRTDKLDEQNMGIAEFKGFVIATLKSIDTRLHNLPCVRSGKCFSDNEAA